MDVDISPTVSAPSPSPPSQTPLLWPPSPLPWPSSPPPSLSQSGCPQRVHRLLARYQDMYPEPPAPAASASTPVTSISTPETISRVSLIVRNRFQTAVNSFGL